MKRTIYFIIFFISLNAVLAQEYFLGGSLDDFGRDVEQTSDSKFYTIKT